MRRFVRFLLATLVSGPLLVTAAAAGEQRAVLELFTSQGCAACPAADALIGEIAGSSDHVALTLPVKLWDFLGWTDTLATEATTHRHLAYATARGDHEVYTPQLVVNGESHVVGSHIGAIEGAVAAGSGLEVTLEATLAGDVLTVVAGEATGDGSPAMLWLFVVESHVKTPVGAGENRGRKLDYHNVVRELRPVGMWKGKELTLDLPLTDTDRSLGDKVVVLAQREREKGLGAVIGASDFVALNPGAVAERR